jgi:hypothetical protein
MVLIPYLALLPQPAAVVALLLTQILLAEMVALVAALVDLEERQQETGTPQAQVHHKAQMAVAAQMQAAVAVAQVRLDKPLNQRQQAAQAVPGQHHQFLEVA